MPQSTHPAKSQVIRPAQSSEAVHGTSRSSRLNQTCFSLHRLRFPRCGSITSTRTAGSVPLGRLAGSSYSPIARSQHLVWVTLKFQRGRTTAGYQLGNECREAAHQRSRRQMAGRITREYSWNPVGDLPIGHAAGTPMPFWAVRCRGWLPAVAMLVNTELTVTIMEELTTRRTLVIPVPSFLGCTTTHANARANVARPVALRRQSRRRLERS